MKTTPTLRIAALIAACNEEDRILDTVAAVALIPEVLGVIVADDGSADNTAQEAARAGAVVVGSGRNLGKGQAMELAAETLEKTQPFDDVNGVLLLDGDLAKSATTAAALLAPLAADEADLVIGILPSPSNRAGFGFTKSLARNAITQYGNGFEARAPLSGQRALTLDCLKKVRPFANGFAMEVDMTIRALQLQQRVVEVPVEMTHRYSGRNLSGFLHRGKQFMQINSHINSHFKK